MIWILLITLVLLWALGLKAAFLQLQPASRFERACTYAWPLLYLFAFGWAVAHDVRLAWRNRRPGRPS